MHLILVAKISKKLLNNSLQDSLWDFYQARKY